ncbi:MAG TPA: HAD family hydrolase [Acidimicrobiales bacterium]|nr:HAD family hydrolase [Acidimicrobiales bacterium]
MRAFDGVLFDFGHTLFTNRPARACTEAFYASSGIEVDEDTFAACWAGIRERSRQPDELAKGRDTNAALHRACWLALLAPMDVLAPGLCEFTYELESSHRGWEPYPDSAEVLGELRRREVPVGVVSDCGWDIREPFKVYGLEDLVKCFDLSFEHGVCKPDRAIFSAASEHLGVPAARTLFVGDSPLTDGGAAAVGIATYLLPARDRVASPALSAVLDLVG